MISKNKYYINFPRVLFLDLKNESINKGVCIFLFCFLIRYGSFDGYYYGSLEIIIKKMNNKIILNNRNTTKTEKDFRSCLDYLIGKKVLELLNGNYKNKTNHFEIKLNEDYTGIKTNYLSISVAQFDYLLSLESRINKPNMFFLLFWIINCSTNNDDGIIINACSYSIKHMADILNITQPSIVKYLSKLCGEENTDAPLLCFKNETLLINGDFRRFPNIYVKNDKNAKKNVELQKKYIKTKFILRKIPGTFDEVVDYEDLY